MNEFIFKLNIYYTHFYRICHFELEKLEDKIFNFDTLGSERLVASEQVCLRVYVLSVFVMYICVRQYILTHTRMY